MAQAPDGIAVPREAPAARPRGRRWWLWMLAAVAALPLLAAGAYLFFAIRLYNSQPIIARNYTAEYNAPIRAIPIEERAWPEYRRAIYTLRQAGPEFGSQTVRPGWTAWPAAKAFVEQHAEELAIVRAAARRPRMGCLLADEDDWCLIDSATNHLSEAENPQLISLTADPLLHLKSLSRLLVIDAFRAAEMDDADLVSQDLAAMAMLCEQLMAEGGPVINQLVGVTVGRMGLETTCEIVQQYPGLMNESQRHQVAEAIEKVASARVRIDLSGDLMEVEDVLQRSFTDDGHGSGRATFEFIATFDDLSGDDNSKPPGFGRALTRAWMAWFIQPRAAQSQMLRDLLAEFERNHARPLWQWEEEQDIRQTLSRLSGGQSPSGYFILALFGAQWEGCAQTYERLGMQRDAVLAIMAMHQYFQEHRRWPDTLDDLVPDYLPTVPIDRFNGQPLRYRLVDGEPRVYSVGQNLLDDGGQNVDDDSDNQTFKPRALVEQWRREGAEFLIAPGDWVFWPPPVRKEPPAVLP